MIGGGGSSGGGGAAVAFALPLSFGGSGAGSAAGGAAALAHGLDPLLHRVGDAAVAEATPLNDPRQLVNAGRLAVVSHLGPPDPIDVPLGVPPVRADVGVKIDLDPAAVQEAVLEIPGLVAGEHHDRLGRTARLQLVQRREEERIDGRVHPVHVVDQQHLPARALEGAGPEQIEDSADVVDGQLARVDPGVAAHLVVGAGVQLVGDDLGQRGLSRAGRAGEEEGLRVGRLQEVGDQDGIGAQPGHLGQAAGLVLDRQRHGGRRPGLRCRGQRGDAHVGRSRMEEISLSGEAVRRSSGR
jgi:hypothetical protein